MNVEDFEIIASKFNPAGLPAKQRKHLVELIVKYQDYHLAVVTFLMLNRKK